MHRSDCAEDPPSNPKLLRMKMNTRAFTALGVSMDGVFAGTCELQSTRADSRGINPKLRSDKSQRTGFCLFTLRDARDGTDSYMLNKIPKTVEHDR
jgi:hypothetical protein